jgi:Holliday junction DNA helicase RuvA
VWVWLSHTEQAMKLYGFASPESRTVFQELCSVDGIGPKNALKIMSGISREELRTAIEADDLARLQSIPGLGKKTAQKLLLALKGKIVRHAAAGPAPKSASPYSDLADALTRMGYDRRASLEALEQVAAETAPELPKSERENEVFRKAISRLTSGL